MEYATIKNDIVPNNTPDKKEKEAVYLQKLAWKQKAFVIRTRVYIYTLFLIYNVHNIIYYLDLVCSFFRVASLFGSRQMALSNQR